MCIRDSNYIRLSDKNDTNNTIYYKASGRTQYYDRDYDSNLNGQHSFDLSDISVTFSKQQEIQTDWTPPELTSLGALRDIEVAQNQKFKINYSAFDAETELNFVQFNFRNENGNTFQLSDNDDDGIATGQFYDWYQEGAYTLDYIRLNDRNNNSNEIIYYNDGTTQFWDGQSNSDVFGEHDFDFSGLSVEFKKVEDAGTTEQTDFTPPELTSFNFSSLNFKTDKPNLDDGQPSEEEGENAEPPSYPEFIANAGERIFIKYDAFDADSALNYVNIRFRHEETGRTIYGSSSDADGHVRLDLSSDLENGKYVFENMSISDNANQNNSINYRADGRTDYWDTSKSQTIYGNHELPLSTLAFTVAGGADPPPPPP